MTQLEGKFKAIREVLRRKLDPREITFAASRHRRAGVPRRPRQPAAHRRPLKGLAAIDEAHLRERLAALAGDGVDRRRRTARPGAAGAPRAAERQREPSTGLAENEPALTQIDHAMAAIAADTSAGHASMTMESAMAELKVLAERAPRYAGEERQPDPASAREPATLPQRRSP